MTQDSVRFGPFVLDTRSRELRRGEARIRLQEQPYEILALLLERPGRLVTREELRDRLWPGGTFVDYEHSLNAAVKRLRAALGDDAENPRFIETLPRRGYRLIAPVSAEGAPKAAASPMARLAVLPFSDLGGPGHEYLADGLTEEMIAQLGRLCRGRIGVIARWSSMTFKGTTERARAIGDALRVEYLLEGSVRRDGDRVRIVARLVETRDETQLWTETYERSLADGLALQTNVAERIARSLAMELAPSGPDPTRGTTPVEAYREYLKARYYWNQPDDDRQPGATSNVTRALACLDGALAIDPGFAAAHAMAARIQVAHAQQYLSVPRAALETARASAVRALELDPGLAEAHLALADVRRMLEWDWRGAEQAYIGAIALNPSHENVHRRYSLMLAIQSRPLEAVREAELACDLDPFYLGVMSSAALVEYLSGYHEAALARCRRIIEIGPEYLPARRLLGATLLATGQTREALETLEGVHAELGNAPIAISWLAHARAVAGHTRGALELLERLDGLSRVRYVSPYHHALALAGTERLDEAFALLGQAAGDRDPALAYVAVEPRFDPLRRDARYASLLERIGLSPR